MLFQRLARLRDESGVLDSDNRLIGEGGDEFDLLVCEWFDLLTGEHDNAARLPFSQKRHTKCGALPGKRRRF